MDVNTSRFGTVEVEDDRVITFRKGLLGFNQYCRFVVLQPSDDGCFFWLQSVDAPDLAFVVTDPSLFYPEYRVPIKSDQAEEMGMANIDEAQVFVIVNKRGEVLTANLQGPLVIHTGTRAGEQLVLSDRRYHTRMKLMDLSENVSAASA
ncbi:MAG: flagellar assembly protein FliW [Phycisphaerae bacterium]|nr:flagellar assembly protein FliW [Phycisphaerae bacterium]